MRAIFFARAARRIIIRLFFFLSGAAVKEYYKMRGKGSYWRERERERERECVFFVMHGAKEFFLVVKKKGERRGQEKRTKATWSNVAMYEVKHFCCVFTNIKTCTSSLYL